MRENIKHKLPLIVGVGLPLLLVLWILVFAYFLPKIFVKPSYNFIYVSGYNSRYVYVHDERVQLDPYLHEKQDYFLRGLDFYLYDVKSEESIPLSFGEAESYRLDSSEKSSDGYIVRSKRDYSGDFFWGVSSRHGYYISKNNTWSKQISIRDDYYNFKWLGWVLNKNE